MNMRNPIARARGHGSAKAGVHHWYAQRASAVLLIFLVAWLIYGVLSLAGGGYEASRTFIANPVNAALLGLLLVVVLYHAMLGQAGLKNLIVDSAITSLKVIPSNLELIGFEVEMMSKPNRQNTLKELIAAVDSAFEYIILDCPPSLTLLTVNALTAANSLLIPLQCEYYAMEGLGHLMNTISLIRQSLNPSLQLEGILFTILAPRQARAVRRKGSHRDQLKLDEYLESVRSVEQRVQASMKPQKRWINDGDLGLERPHLDAVAELRRVACKGGSPGSRTDDCDRPHSTSPRSWLHSGRVSAAPQRFGCALENGRGEMEGGVVGEGLGFQAA